MAVANSYAEGWRAWDERYADLVVGKRNWQLAAGGLLVVSIILAAGLVWLSSRSRYVVYAVQVDKLGYALTQAQPLTPAAAPDMIDRIERYEVASFIRQARTVTSDAQVSSWTSITTRIVRPITRSRSHRKKLFRCRSIRSCNFPRRATTYVGPKCGAI
jgi:type IV secretory pathway TrbF-like protein